MSEQLTIHGKLQEIQSRLKVDKGQKNSHGGFMYRSNEDILNKVKPIAKECGTVVFQSDELIERAGQIFIEATTTLVDVATGEVVSSTAYAGHQLTKKGMDFSQISGSSSSYARKYSASALFAIDNEKDADSMDNRKNVEEQQAEQQRERDALRLESLVDRMIHTAIDEYGADQAMVDKWRQMSKQEAHDDMVLFVASVKQERGGNENG